MTIDWRKYFYFATMYDDFLKISLQHTDIQLVNYIFLLGEEGGGCGINNFLAKRKFVTLGENMAVVFGITN